MSAPRGLALAQPLLLSERTRFGVSPSFSLGRTCKGELATPVQLPRASEYDGGVEKARFND